MKHPRLLNIQARADLDSGERVAVETPKLCREIPLDVRNVTVRKDGDEEDAPELLEMEIAFASEFPVERYYGTEELVVTREAARVERVEQGVCPVLRNHYSTEPVGRVLEVTIGSDRVARARIRFSRSAGARDVVQDVVDGIRQGVSFGYRIHKMELYESGDDGDRYRITDWELFEITIASIPADPTVGTHRSGDEDRFETIVVSKEDTNMKKVRAVHLGTGAIVMVREDLIDDETYALAADAVPTDPKPGSGSRSADPQPNGDEGPSRDQIIERERERVANIESLGATYKASKDEIREAVKAGTSVDDFVGKLRLKAADEGKPLEAPPSDLDMPKRDLENYSIVNAIRVLLDRRNGRPHENSIELEASDEIAKRTGKSPGGFLVPYEVLTRSPWGQPLHVRAPIGKGTDGGLGGALVATELMDGGFIDILRVRSVLGRLGVTFIPGLVGDVDFPKQLTSAVAGWVGEGAGAGDTPVSFGVVSMTPHTLRGRVDMTRKMLLQGTPAIEMLVRNDLVTVMAKEMDRVGLHGSGLGAEPLGVFNAAGIGVVVWDETSGQTENSKVIELETVIAAANADEGIKYVTTPEVRGRLKGKYKDPGSGQPVWTGQRNEGELNGYGAEVTNSVPKNLGVGTNEHLIGAGYFPWLYFGEWGVLEVKPDDITLGDSDGLVVRAFQDADVVAAHAAAFASSSVDVSQA